MSLKELTDIALIKEELKKPLSSEEKKAVEEVKKFVKDLSDNGQSFSEEQVKSKIKDIIKICGNYDSSAFDLDNKNVDLLVKDNKTPAVFIETKSINNYSEMPAVEDLNRKGFLEILTYYFNDVVQNILNNQKEYTKVKYFIVTNGLEWFVFPERQFTLHFAHNKELRKQFNFDGRNTLFKNTKKEIYDYLKEYFADHSDVLKTLNYYHISLSPNSTENTFEALYLFLTPEIFFNKPTIHIRRTALNKNFYDELLYIMGLKEERNKIVPAKVEGSFYEQLKAFNKWSDEDILELLIIWFNRILFLKLFEARLVEFNRNNEALKFMNIEKIGDFASLNNLFFQVLAVKENDRKGQDFHYIPYLNSSLFEETQKEKETTLINALANKNVDYYKGTVLRDKVRPDKKREGKEHLLNYLFEFLDSYNFGTTAESSLEELDLISPAVLGLIFEKINGYKDGSYYTPSEITDYIAGKTIKQRIISKINAGCKTNYKDFGEFASVFNRGQLNSYREKINNIIDTLTIIDPAVGSGHFLVSALNVLLQIKWELGFITENHTIYREYNLMKTPYDILFDCKYTEEPFIYKKPKGKGELQQEFQEILFNAKKKIIENNLFGVDINPKAVEIARLRLWIELLKNAYYTEESNFTRMETLPNIDINIKIGNSLLAPILGVNISLFSQGEDISHYKKLLTKYQNASNKEEKRKTREKIEQVRNNIIRDCVSENYKDLIWAIDFPQIIDDNGNFIGFDIVIGNPPYISLSKFRNTPLQKAYKDKKYDVYDTSGDIYCLFYELGVNLLTDKGILAYITSNKWMRTAYGKKLRQFFLEYNPLELIDLGPGIFESATVDTNILILQRGKNKNSLKAVTAKRDDKGKLNLKYQLNKEGVEIKNLNIGTWFIGNKETYKLKEKIEKIGTSLENWHLNIYRGVLTGFNKAFIVTTEKRDEILANCKTGEEKERTKEIIKPILRGRDIGRYYYKWESLWMIKIEAGWTDKNRGDTSPEEFIYASFPSLMNYLESYKTKAEKRYDKGNYWWELRQCAYYPEFEKEKIVWQEIVREPSFAYDNKKFYCEATTFLMTGKNLKYLIAILNSTPSAYFFKTFYAGGGLGSEGYRYKKAFLEKFPIPKITPQNKELAKSIEDKANQIFVVTSKETYDPNTDTEGNKRVKELEYQIDQLVYKLYTLTPEEIKIIEESSLSD